MASRLVAGLALVVGLATAGTVEAQDLEPREYANARVGLNFLILGYGYTRGDVAVDSSAPIEDAQLTAHAAFLAYARALDVWGRAGKLDVILPYGWVSGTAAFAGQPLEGDVSGLATLASVSRCCCTGPQLCRRRSSRSTHRTSSWAPAWQ